MLACFSFAVMVRCFCTSVLVVSMMILLPVSGSRPCTTRPWTLSYRTVVLFPSSFPVLGSQMRLVRWGGGHVPNSAQVDAALVEGGVTSSTAPGTEAPTALLSMYADDVPKQLRTHTHRHFAYSGCAQASEWLMVLPPMPFSVTLRNNSTHAYRSPGPCSSIQ